MLGCLKDPPCPTFALLGPHFQVKLYTTGMVGFRYFNLFSPEVHPGKLPQTAVFEVKRQDTDKHPFHLEVPLHVSEYSRHILQYRTPQLDAGEYHLVFTYTKQPGVEFALRSLTVVGEESGGAVCRAEPPPSPRPLWPAAGPRLRDVEVVAHTPGGGQPRTGGKDGARGGGGGPNAD